MFLHFLCYLVVLCCPCTICLSNFVPLLSVCGYKMDFDANVANVHHAALFFKLIYDIIYYMIISTPVEIVN